MSHILLLAPWWLDEGHVGNRRLKRHVRWLTDQGHKVTLVCAGPDFQIQSDEGIQIIVIPDPLRIHGPASAPGKPSRKPSALRRWLAYALFNPDPSILWTRAVMRHPIVRHQCRTADLITASSPPEAPFIGAASLAWRYKIPFWMDLRDGWLDEPLKPLLRRHAWQRWREGRLEAACVKAAKRITVTSEAWTRMLLARYPDIGPKISVVTNAAADSVFTAASAPTGIAYAGRFGSSRPERSIRTLAAILPELTVIGDLTADEIDDIRQVGWVLRPSVPVAELPQLLSLYAGLVLLSESMGSIPAKFYDYLAAGRPILAVCRAHSAMWAAGESIGHVYRIDPAAPDQAVINRFEVACCEIGRHPVPERFREDRVRKDLLTALEDL